MKDILPFPTRGGDYIHKDGKVVAVPSVEADKPDVLQTQEPSTVAEAAVPEEDEQEQPAHPEGKAPWER